MIPYEQEEDSNSHGGEMGEHISENNRDSHWNSGEEILWASYPVENIAFILGEGRRWDILWETLKFKQRRYETRFLGVDSKCTILFPVYFMFLLYLK